MQDNYFIERKIKTNKKINELLCEMPPFISEFIVGIENKTSELTRINYLLDLRIFFDYLQRTKFSSIKIQEISLKDIERLTTTDIESFLNYTNAFKYYGKYLTNGERGKSRKLSVIRTFFKYFYNKDKISHNITTKLSMPKIHDKNIVRLEIDEVSNLLKTAESPTAFSDMQKGFHSHTKLRDIAILTTLLGTGIRVSELQFITVEAVRRGEEMVSCKNKTRTIFIVRELQKKLLNYIKARGMTTGSVFVTKSGKPMSRCNIWREMKNLCEHAGVNPSKVFPHNLRHLFARTFYGIEKDIARLADLLGHSSINTTRIYIITTGAEHKRKMENMRLII